MLKFLENSSVCKYYISTVSRLKWLAISFGSPRTSLTPTRSNETSVFNLHLWGGGGGSNVTRGGRFCNLLDLLIGWSSTIENLTNQTLRPTRHRKNHRVHTIKNPKASNNQSRVKDMISRRKLKNDCLASLKWFLGTSEGITQPPSYTFNKGYLPSPFKVNQK